MSQEDVNKFLNMIRNAESKQATESEQEQARRELRNFGKRQDEDEQEEIPAIKRKQQNYLHSKKQLERFGKKEEQEEQSERKTKKLSYLHPRRVLSSKEYSEYQALRKSSRKLSLQDRIKEMRKENKDKSRIARYEITKSGRIGKGLSKGITALRQKGGVTRLLYRQPLSSRQAQINSYRLAQARQRAIQQQQWNNMFIGDNRVFDEVEREVSGVGGYADEGNRQSLRIGQEAFGIGNNNFVNPVRAIEFESLNHAKNQHRKSIFDIENETLSFANLFP